MKISSLKFADFIASHPRQVPFYDVPAWAIQWYQKARWGDLSRWEDTHIIIYLGENRIFEVTSPRARFAALSDILTPEKRYTVARYRRVNLWQRSWEEKDAILYACDRINGTRYDYGQLLDIAIKGLFGFIPQGLGIFDLGRKRKVCSVGCGAILRYWWCKFGKAKGIPRPLGPANTEILCPADFVNYSQDFFPIEELALN